MAMFANAAVKKVKQAGNFEVLSYHGRNSAIIGNYTVVGGDLKECEGANNMERRPAGINYATLFIDLDFSDIDPLCTTVQPFTFYVCFLQGDMMVATDVPGTDIRLMAFHGPSN